MSNTANAMAICVISFERGELTDRCLVSIQKETDGDYHVFLIDNGSRDSETLSILRKWESWERATVYRFAENRGPSAARNKALELAGNGFTAFAMLDNDIVVLPGWQRAAWEALGHGCDLVQPKLIAADMQTVERGPNIPNPSKLSAHPTYLGVGAERNDETVSASKPVSIVGGTGIVRTSVFHKIGIYDPNLHFGEDYDLSFRACAAGCRLEYIPDCEMVHDHRFNLEYDQQRQDLRKILSSHVVMWRKHRKVLLSPAYMSWYSWLYRNNEPIYLPRKRDLKSLPRRARRRIVRDWIMRRLPKEWSSVESAKERTSSLALLIRMDGNHSFGNQR